MEQLIILIVIGLVSTLFNKKGKTDPEKNRPQDSNMPERPVSRPAATPPQRTETAGQTDPFKRLKELTGEIYREIQEEQQKPEQKPSPARPEVVLQAPRTERPARPADVKRPETRSEREPRRSSRESSARSGRLSAHNPESQATPMHTSSNLDISDEQDILKGIIFSEILGPPKSKR